MELPSQAAHAPESRTRRFLPLVSALLVSLPNTPSQPQLQLLVLTALLFSAGYIGRGVAIRLLPRLPWMDRVIASAACAIACSLLVGVVLGHLELLYGSLFRGVVAGVTAIVWWCNRAPSPGARDARRARLIRRLSVEQWTVLCCCTLAAVGLANGIYRNRYAAPGTFAYDDTYYHLTAVATWNVGHDFAMPRFSYGDPRPQFYPFASELLAWELTTPFDGGDFAARWVELPFALLSLLAVALIARRLRTPITCAVLASLLYASVPRAYPAYALSAGNDHAVAFALLACLHAAVLIARRLTVGRAGYAGIAFGLLLAIKYTSLLFAPPLAAVFLIAVLSGFRRADAPLRDALAGVGSWALFALLVGGYSYLRNFVTKDNPFFPVGFTLGPLALHGWRRGAVHLSRGRPDAAIDAWAFPWVRTDLLGFAFRLTALPASVLAPLLALLRGSVRTRIFTGSVLALAPLFYLEFLWFIEDHRDIRYIFCAVAVAAIAAAWLIAQAPPSIRPALTIGVALLSASRWLTDIATVAGAATVLAVLAALAAGSFLKLRLTRPLTLVALCSWVGGAVVRGYESHRLDGSPAAAALASITGGQPVAIAYSGWNQPYLFSGAHMQDPVYMVPTGGALTSMLYRWGGPTSDPYKLRRRNRWLSNLCVLDVGYVVHVDSPHSGPVSRWTTDSPEFSQVYQDERTRIWRFDRRYCSVATYLERALRLK